MSALRLPRNCGLRGWDSPIPPTPATAPPLVAEPCLKRVPALLRPFGCAAPGVVRTDIQGARQDDAGVQTSYRLGGGICGDAGRGRYRYGGPRPAVAMANRAATGRRAGNGRH